MTQKRFLQNSIVYGIDVHMVYCASKYYTMQKNILYIEDFLNIIHTGNVWHNFLGDFPCIWSAHTGGKIVVGKTALAIIIIETSINILMEVCIDAVWTFLSAKKYFF